ncbi:MAG: hypothetical protein RJQ14_03700 [Marinoscillum sp.]
MILTATNQTIAANNFEDFDAEELAMLDATLSKIKAHLDKNIEGSSDPQKISKLMSYKWYINQTF